MEVLMPASSLQDLLDRREIEDVILRYGRATDRCDEALLRSMFHDDATESHGGLMQGSAAEFCRAALAMLRGTGPTAHYMTNILVELDGDVAHTETYAIAMHRLVRGGRDYDSFFAGRLLDRFERRSGAWRIAHRTVLYDWNRDVPSEEHWGFGTFGDASNLMRGIKDRSDPVYRDG
jgi:ketosteroid isomerase-like protein